MKGNGATADAALAALVIAPGLLVESDAPWLGRAGESQATTDVIRATTAATSIEATRIPSA